MPAAAATPNSNRWFYVKFKPLMTLQSLYTPQRPLVGQ